MTRLSLIISILILTSCKDGKLREYESIVQEADRFDIYYNATNKTVTVPGQLAANFKSILTRNVKPEMQRKFIGNIRIDIYKSDQRTAFLTIAGSNTNPFANFNSGSLHFGFRLTYGIGQAIDNLYDGNSR